VRKDIKIGTLVGLAISVAAGIAVMTMKSSEFGVIDPALSPEKFQNENGRPGDNAGSAVSYAPQPAPPPPPAAEPAVKADNADQTPLVPVKATRFHIVQSGETLSSIAKKHYGSTSAAGKIFEANRATMENPNRLRPGMKLTIPD
jgi:nucleoid-associated protein YgaU